ncbi:MAG: hypothetical protein DRG11_03100 [Epsilonproteobacteria bacterium]|nr:MAG: hypothetical protein DRG11_03100 [Campylobacterota bacterium]
MQFYKDKTGEYLDIFFKLRQIVLSFDNITEKKNPKQTAYYDKYGAVCFIRPNKTTNQTYCMSLAKGHKLMDKFPNLQGCGKITRHINFKSIDDIDINYIKDIIQESLILNMEQYELKKLAKNIK